MRKDKKKRRKKKNESGGCIHTEGVIMNADMFEAAELHPMAFYQINPDDKLPVEWFERAATAWKYYREEPFVNNIINMWRVFAVGDNIHVVSDDKDVQFKARDFAERMKLNGLSRT